MLSKGPPHLFDERESRARRAILVRRRRHPRLDRHQRRLHVIKAERISIDPAMHIVGKGGRLRVCTRRRRLHAAPAVLSVITITTESFVLLKTGGFFQIEGGKRP